MQHPIRIAIVLASALALSSCALLPIRPHLAVVDESVDQPALAKFVGFDTQLDEHSSVEIVPAFVRDPGWLAITTGAGPSVYELVEIGCVLFVGAGESSSLVRFGSDDLESTSLAIGEHLQSERFSAESFRWLSLEPDVEVEGLLVISEIEGSGTVTVARAFQSSGTQALMSLSCVPGVDSLAVFNDRVAGKAPLVLR